MSDLKSLNDGKWYLVTVTWKSEGGAWNMYLNDQLEDSGENLATGQVIPGGGVLVIGQEQDTLGGGFSASQEFLGMLSQIIQSYLYPLVCPLVSRKCVLQALFHKSMCTILR